MGESKVKHTEKKECDCIFCNSKCPECGSTAIRVTFKPQLEYYNDTENCIFIVTGVTSIKVECEECGEIFEQDDNSSDDKLDPLIRSLHRALDIPIRMSFTCNKDGTIEEKGYRIEFGEPIKREDGKGLHGKGER